nr:glycosyltransferase [Halalkalibacter akibai]
MAKSKGQFIIFCDADFIVIPTFLKILEKYHTKHPDSVVSGIPNSWNMVFTQYYPQFTLEQRSLLYHTLYDKGLWKNEYWGDESQIKTLLTPKQLTEDFNKIEDFIFQEKVDERTIKEYEETTYAPWLLFVTRCVSVKRRNLDKVGWFDERFKKYGLEDWELGYRLHLEGVSFVSMRERVGYHQEHPKAQSEADGNNENLKYMFEKFGFSDPELNLFSFCPAYDNIALYKDHLRSLDKLKKKGKKKKYKNMNQEWKSLAKEFYYQ